MTDEELFQLCKTYGERARLWRQKFAGLLPEVYRRHLYKKKGFGSIFEFAAKLAGMGEEQVKRVLSIDEKFNETPILKSMLENGEVSVNKLARIASVVSKETEEFWADQIKVLPRTALETLVRDQKNDMRRSLHNAISTENLVHVHASNSTNRRAALRHKSSGYLQLSAEVEQKLLTLQEKGIDINALLLEFLEKREFEIAQEKEEISTQTEASNSRYIPTKIKTFLKKEYGEKCSIQTCMKLAQVIHHTQRFSLSKNHNPKFLAPLCREHHIIAHSIDVKFHEERAYP